MTEFKPITCPTCLMPGYPVRGRNDTALFSHPGRHFPCRVMDPARVQEYRRLALYTDRSPL
jgi:hypothetical protein